MSEVDIVLEAHIDSDCMNISTEERGLLMVLDLNSIFYL